MIKIIEKGARNGNTYQRGKGNERKSEEQKKKERVGGLRTVSILWRISPYHSCPRWNFYPYQCSI
jgi:hypothetical protein